MPVCFIFEMVRIAFTMPLFHSFPALGNNSHHNLIYAYFKAFRKSRVAFPLFIFHDESFFGGEHVQVRMPKWPLKPWFSWRRNPGKQNLQNWCLDDPNETTKLVQQSSSWDGDVGSFLMFFVRLKQMRDAWHDA